MAFQVTCRECGHINQIATPIRPNNYICGECGITGSLPAAPESLGNSTRESTARFHCPSCGRKYAINPVLAGKKVRCKGCGEGVWIPGAESAPSQSKIKVSETSPHAIPPEQPAADTEQGVTGRTRSHAVPPSESEARGQVHQKVPGREAVESTKSEVRGENEQKDARNTGYFDPRETLTVAGGITAFVAVLAFLSWCYPDLRFLIGTFLCILGFIVYLLGAASLKQVVTEEGFHHVVLFQYFPPYQWYLVATRWSETKDFVAFFATGLIILGIGVTVLKTSPIGKKGEDSERAEPRVQQGSQLVPPPAFSGGVAKEID